MRKTMTVATVVAVLAAGVGVLTHSLIRTSGQFGRIGTQIPEPREERAKTLIAVPSVTTPTPVARLDRRVEEIAAHDEHAAAQPSTPEVDDGDDHGQAQGEVHALEEPTSRDAFGADPESETAALAEVRATLEALLNDPDPAVNEQASAVLQTIAGP
jgi:hypothetical protein